MPTTWAALLAGTSGAVALTDEWAEELPVRIAARVAVEPVEVLERVKARRLDRSGQFALIAALEAWKDSGLSEASEAGDVDSERLGVAMASGIGGVTTLLSNYDTLLGEGPAPGLAAVDPDADAQQPGGQRRPGHRRQGGRAHARLGMRIRQRGDRSRRRHDPARPRRRRRRRRHRGGDPPAADGRLRQHDGAVQAQRRPRARLASVGHRPRRLPARRGRRRARASRAPSTPKPAAPGCTPRSPAPASRPTLTTSPSPTPRGSAQPGR